MTKSLIGVEGFDRRFGGVYCARTALVCGPDGVGKSSLALLFLQTGIGAGEPGLLLAEDSPETVIDRGLEWGVDVEGEVALGQLTVLNYPEYAPDVRASTYSNLPSDSFEALRQVIEEKKIRRVALDTVLPWVQIADAELAARVTFSLVRALDKLGVTTLLTIPLPNSGPARELRRILECNVPCALEIVHSSSATDPALREGRRIVPRKYLGAVTLGEPIGWEHPGVKH